MLGFLKKLFGGGAQEPARQETGRRRATPAQRRNNHSRRSASAGAEPGRQPDPVGFVKYVVQSLVDDPEAVRIEEVERGRETEIRIHCAKEDRGKVIGRNGKTITALRTLVAGAGGRIRRKFNVELAE